MENVTEIPDAYNRFRVANGLNSFTGVKISEYVTFVKARKVIRALTENDLTTLNETLFGSRLNKFNKWTKEKLLSKLDLLNHVKLLRFLYVKEKESVMDSLLCMLSKKKFAYDAKFLVNYFKYGTALPEGRGE